MQPGTKALQTMRYVLCRKSNLQTIQICRQSSCSDSLLILSLCRTQKTYQLCAALHDANASPAHCSSQKSASSRLSLQCDGQLNNIFLVDHHTVSFAEINFHFRHKIFLREGSLWRAMNSCIIPLSATPDE